MDNQRNRRLYRLWSPGYDLVFRPVFKKARRRAIDMLEMQPGEHLLIPGVGTGLDLELLPDSIRVIGIDLSTAMLSKAQGKVAERDIALLEMDAQQLAFPNAHFDAVLFNLLLSVVPDGKLAFNEGWRVLRPGGRMVIFDKFLAAEQRLKAGRRIVGRFVRAFGTDPNRRLSEIIGDVPNLTIKQNEASLLRGQYRLLYIEKAG